MNSEELRRRREALGLTQGQLAERLQVRRQTIGEWETGTREIRLPAVLALALWALEHGSGDDPPADPDLPELVDH